METISNIYETMLSDGSEDYERVGWGSLESQQKRFKILSEIGDLSHCSILDVGCGLGDLYDFLIDKYSDITYSGTDINSKMIQGAVERHPTVKFTQTDITSDLSILKEREFDYVFLSGALNLSEDKHEETILNIVDAMFTMAKKGVGINFLSIFSDYFTPGEYYSNPVKIMELAFSITHNVVLRHDYMPHDFTLYLYK